MRGRTTPPPRSWKRERHGGHKKQRILEEASLAETTALLFVFAQRASKQKVENKHREALCFLIVLCVCVTLCALAYNAHVRLCSWLNKPNASTSFHCASLLVRKFWHSFEYAQQRFPQPQQSITGNECMGYHVCWALPLSIYIVCPHLQSMDQCATCSHVVSLCLIWEMEPPHVICLSWQVRAIKATGISLLAIF